MAYELSSSIGGDKTVDHVFVPARASTFTIGGYPNLDGTKIASPSYRHGGAGSSDYGVDIWHSGASGWVEVESIDSGANIARSLFWFSNSEIITIESDNKLRSYASSSGGWYNQWSATSAATSATHLFLSPGRSRIVALQSFQQASETHMDDDCKVFVYESSSTGFLNYNTYDADDGRVTAVSFVDETNLLIGQPGYKTGGGQKAGRIQHISYDGSSWSGVRTCQGHQGTNARMFGWALHWHTSSNSLLVGASNDNTGVFTMWNMPSQSDGYIPSGNPHLVADAVLLNDTTGSAVLDSDKISGNTVSNAYTANGVGFFTASHGSRIVATTIGHSSTYDGAVHYTIESGSDGWKFNQFEDDGVWSASTGVGQNIAGNSSIYVGFQTGSHASSQGGFTVYRFLPSGGGASPDITLDPTSLTLTEGQNDEITVVLDSQPSSNVVVTASLHSDFNGRATLTNHLLTFTNGNWDSPQILQVTASQDSIANGAAGPDPITFSVVDGSSDDAYDGISKTATLTVNDNETAGFTISPTSLSLAEGQDGEVSVVLDVQPAGNVIITASLHNTDFNGRASLTNHILTFTDGNWNTPQILQVTASQDSLINGQEGPNNITFSIVDASSDDNYDPVGDQTVALTVTDNDAAGFTLGETELTLTEGQNDTVSVVLNAQPDSNVVITSSLHSNFDGRATLTNHLITFTNGNWNTPQLLQVTASQDSLINGNVGPNNITFSIVDASSDNNFDSLSDQTVALTVQDNDAAGFTVGTGSLTLTEGQDDTISVVLDAQPGSNVVITASLHSNFNGRATLTNHLLTFTNGNWNVAQLLQVSASQDLIANANVGPNNITFSIVDASSDNNFDALSDQNVALTVLNNDVIVLGEPRLGGLTTSANVITSETGGEDEMSVRLFNQPTHNVTVSVSGVDNTEFTVSPVSLVFTSDNWNEDQLLRFKGLADGSADGDITTTITLTAASSDSAYNGVSVTKNVTNLDTTPSGGFADPCTLLSVDYTINYYTCALGQYDYHKNLPFRLGSAKNISNVREQAPDGSHKTFLGEPKT